MAGLLNIGITGLLAYQRSLDTISHNIANVNTEGYSRQTTELASTRPESFGSGFVGTGVSVASIERAYDAYIESSVRSTTSTQAEFEAYQSLASQLDNVLADSDAGLNATLQRFFNVVQDVADSPADLSARQVMLNEGQQLSDKFNELSSWIENVRVNANSQITTGVNEINRITQTLGNLNETIVIEQGRSGGQPPNDLLDQRDALILELSNYVSVTTISQNDGATNILIGKGQPLVIGSQSTQLVTYVEPGGDPNQIGIAATSGGGTQVPITEQMSGGIVGGVLNFRDRLLEDTTNSLGLTAIGIADFVNQQQRDGMDLNGALGADFFNVGQPQVLTISGTAGNVAVAFDDIGQVTNLDYTIQFNAGAWSLTRDDTGQAVAMAGAGTAVNPFIVDGLSIEVTALPVAGETYQIHPTRYGARDIDMVLGSVQQIAAASPVRSLSATTNAGSGSISAGTITDINNAAFQTTAGALTPPLMIVFAAANSYSVLDTTNPAAPVLLEAGIAYDPATGGDIFPTPGGLDYGYQMRITGAPVAGDAFSTEYNTGGVGDNRNALAMAALSTSKVLSGGTASVSDNYRSLVVDVGISTRQAKQNSDVQQRVLDQVTATHDSISGVNLDEEAANLVRFQQAYQAAAQVISTANSLFDTLLNAVRR